MLTAELKVICAVIALDYRWSQCSSVVAVIKCVILENMLDITWGVATQCSCPFYRDKQTHSSCIAWGRTTIPNSCVIQKSFQECHYFTFQNRCWFLGDIARHMEHQGQSLWYWIRDLTSLLHFKAIIWMQPNGCILVQHRTHYSSSQLVRIHLNGLIYNLPNFR